eukprot:758705-Hanusia_phi.AAC.1
MSLPLPGQARLTAQAFGSPRAIHLPRRREEDAGEEVVAKTRADVGEDGDAGNHALVEMQGELFAQMRRERLQDGAALLFLGLGGVSIVDPVADLVGKEVGASLLAEEEHHSLELLPLGVGPGVELGDRVLRKDGGERGGRQVECKEDG